MGGRGASSSRDGNGGKYRSINKNHLYYDTDGGKVTDKGAVQVAERYLRDSKEVTFVKRGTDKTADLHVDGQYIEVKTPITSNASNIATNLIRKGFKQTDGGGKLIVNCIDNKSITKDVARKAYAEARRKGYVKGTVEFWLCNDTVQYKFVK